MELYDRLEIDTEATPQEIRAAYLKKAKSLHPDVGGDKEAFQRIELAYQILKDSDLRAKYDAEGIIPGETPPDAVLVKQLIQNVYRQTLKEGLANAKKESIVGVVVKVFERGESQLEKDIIGIAEDIENLVSAQESIRSNTDANVFSDVTDAEILVLTNTKTSKENELRITKLSLETLEDYSSLPREKSAPRLHEGGDGLGELHRQLMEAGR